MQQHDLSAINPDKSSAPMALSVTQAFADQVEFCRAHDAPITMGVVAAIAAMLDAPDTKFARRIAAWQGNPLSDALPLRAAAAFHALHLSQSAPQLAPIYAGDASANINALIHAAARRHDAELLPWLDGPPQTNEAGRSALFMAAMLTLADQGYPAQFDVLEIGSSAGINLMMDRYRYDLAGVVIGPENPVMTIHPDWRGPPPPPHGVQFTALTGCDIAPIDLGDNKQSAPLMAYIWPDSPIRFARLQAAIASAKSSPPDLRRADAADFVEDQLRRPQAQSTTRLLMHSLVWQYLPADQQQRIRQAMEKAGAQATPDRPLAWISFEANRTISNNQLTLRSWPKASEPKLLAEAHPHAAWIDWIANT
jgi:hypothetical protein